MRERRNCNNTESRFFIPQVRSAFQSVFISSPTLDKSWVEFTCGAAEDSEWKNADFQPWGTGSHVLSHRSAPEYEVRLVQGMFRFGKTD